MFRPAQAFDRLLATPGHLMSGFKYMVVSIVGYTLMYIFLAAAGEAPSVFTPWLNIEAEEYYRWNRFLLAPSMLLCWLTATAAAQVFSVMAGGTGRFEQLLSVFALSISIAMWGALVHDLPMSILSVTGVIDAREHEIAMNAPTAFRTLLWTCYSIYLIAFVILFSIAIRKVHKLSWPKSVMNGTAAFILFQVIFLVFNR